MAKEITVKKTQSMWIRFGNGDLGRMTIGKTGWVMLGITPKLGPERCVTVFVDGNSFSVHQKIGEVKTEASTGFDGAFSMLTEQNKEMARGA